MAFHKLQLINPQTGKPQDYAYCDLNEIITWQSMVTKYDKPCTLVNFKSGFAYQVNATFDEVSALVLESRGQDELAIEHRLAVKAEKQKNSLSVS